MCGDRYFGVRKAHTAYQDIDFTLRLTASGEVACWVDHHAQKHGLPVSAPHIYSAASGISGASSQFALSSVGVVKRAPWAEGGGTLTMCMYRCLVLVRLALIVVWCVVTRAVIVRSCAGDTTCVECLWEIPAQRRMHGHLSFGHT